MNNNKMLSYVLALHGYFFHVSVAIVNCVKSTAEVSFLPIG